MQNVWNVKAVYPSGGHYVTDVNGYKLTFNNEAAAADYVAMANMNKSDVLVSYIMVKES